MAAQEIVPASMVKPSGLATLRSRVTQSMADMGWEVGIRPGGKNGGGRHCSVLVVSHKGKLLWEML